MAAPDHVPVSLPDRPRTPLAMPPARRWTASRPADLQQGQPRGPKLGSPGPDQGFALKLAELFVPRLQLAERETAEDAVAGCIAVALARASVFRRGPVTYDLEHASRLFGFLEGAPPDLVAFRQPLFKGAAHDYWMQRGIVEVVPESTLRLTPAQVAERLSLWRELLSI